MQLQVEFMFASLLRPLIWWLRSAEKTDKVIANEGWSPVERLMGQNPMGVGAQKHRGERGNVAARARSWLIRRVALAFVAIAALSGCGNAESNADSSSTGAEVEPIAADGVLVCGSRTTVDGHVEHEWYSVTAMNNKLAHYPDLASRTSLREVKTCTQAREIARVLADYQEERPDFDRDEPIDLDALSKETPPPPPAVDDAARLAASGSRQKIRNGTGDRLSPVVRITGMGVHADQYPGPVCTGVFIARNWIATAAHCLQTAKGWTYTQGVPAAKVHKWYQYHVEFAREQGLADRDPEYWYVLQYVDPRYIGFTQENRATHHDFALLYVIDSLDNGLPNNDPTASLSGAPLMRVGLKVSVDTNAATFWGTGPHDPVASGDPILVKGSLVPYAATFTSVVGATAEFRAQVPAGSDVPWICRGDSGGPLVDRYNIRNPDTGVVEPQYVAAGLLSFFFDTTGAAIPDNVLCADATKYKVGWTRLEEEKDLIEHWVSQWYTGFPCKEGRSEGSTSVDFLQCWGKPCKLDSSCPDDQFCYHPGSQLKLCSQCGAGSSCDCIYGQCLPKQE